MGFIGIMASFFSLVVNVFFYFSIFLAGALAVLMMEGVQYPFQNQIISAFVMYIIVNGLLRWRRSRIPVIPAVLPQLDPQDLLDLDELLSEALPLVRQRHSAIRGLLTDRHALNKLPEGVFGIALGMPDQNDIEDNVFCGAVRLGGFLVMNCHAYRPKMEYHTTLVTKRGNFWMRDLVVTPDPEEENVLEDMDLFYFRLNPHGLCSTKAAETTVITQEGVSARIISLVNRGVSSFGTVRTFLEGETTFGVVFYSGKTKPGCSGFPYLVGGKVVGLHCGDYNGTYGDGANVQLVLAKLKRLSLGNRHSWFWVLDDRHAEFTKISHSGTPGELIVENSGRYYYVDQEDYLTEARKRGVWAANHKGVFGRFVGDERDEEDYENDRRSDSDHGRSRSSARSDYSDDDHFSNFEDDEFDDAHSRWVGRQKRHGKSLSGFKTGLNDGNPDSDAVVSKNVEGPLPEGPGYAVTARLRFGADPEIRMTSGEIKQEAQEIAACQKKIAELLARVEALTTKAQDYDQLHVQMEKDRVRALMEAKSQSDQAAAQYMVAISALKSELAKEKSERLTTKEELHQMHLTVSELRKEMRSANARLTEAKAPVKLKPVVRKQTKNEKKVERCLELGCMYPKEILLTMHGPGLDALLQKLEADREDASASRQAGAIPRN
ncbi:hypothetical protein 1 [Shahe sobemo-like virus 1]|uniref:hypothetical protein 1 n=1 Tax=Shahe sobemo-like virus 1 TaxID=1923454 RepID=UPI00090BB57A|nr:hypothetical protein 1 [Shahe sobemo-like virus 1]APG75821.1 hypothetical protein 1 [Shahe sobemo-like virus 1]